MDRLKKYQQAVEAVLENYVGSARPKRPGVEKQIIADLKRNRFQVIHFGWKDEEEMVFSTLLHLEIMDGKVWIHQNWTELQIADLLMEKGVERSDIVLGFVPAWARSETGFALA